MRRVCALVAIVVVMLLAARRADAQWTQFRGPNGSGVGADTGYPVEFSPSKNVVWKTAVPNAPSSPVVIGERVFLTASQGDQLLTIALDAKTGKRGVAPADSARAHAQDLQVQRSGVAHACRRRSGRGRVLCRLRPGGVCQRREGSVAPSRWAPSGTSTAWPRRRSSSVTRSSWSCDQAAGSFLLALDRASGRVRWKTERTGRTVGWATPMVFRPAGRARAARRAGVGAP